MSKGRFAHRAFTVALVAGYLCARSLPARAEELATEARAAAVFQRGIEAAERGDLTRAASEFEAAQALSPNPVVLYNLGQTYTALGWPVQAERALRLYLEGEPPPTDSQRIEEVKRLIEFNLRRIGTLLVELVPADAELEVDGVPLALTPPGKVRLAVGRHVLVATLAGREPRIANVDVFAGQEVRVVLELEPPRENPAGAPVPVQAEGTTQRGTQGPAASAELLDPAEPEGQGMSTQRAVGLALTGAGGVAFVVGAVLGFETIRLKNESNQNHHCDASGCDEEGMRLRSVAVNDGKWATGMFIGGAVAVAAGLALYFLDGGGARSPSAAFGSSANVQAVRPGRLDLAVEF
jgi:hypothetical protein